MNRVRNETTSAEQARAIIRNIVPRLPKSQHELVRQHLKILEEGDDPDVPVKARDGDHSLLEAIIRLGFSGGEFSSLIGQARRDSKSFDILIELLDDHRVFPDREGADWELRRHLGRMRAYRVLNPRGRHWRVSDYALLILDELCQRRIIGSHSDPLHHDLQPYTRRANLWRKASRQTDPAAYLRSNWFKKDKQGQRCLNMTAIELQAFTDFDALVTYLPSDLGIVSLEGLDKLPRLIFERHAMIWSTFKPQKKLSPEERRALTRRPGQLMMALYEASEGNSVEVRAQLLCNALCPATGDEEIVRLSKAAIKWLNQSAGEADVPYAHCDAAVLARIPVACHENKVWEGLASAAKKAPPGLAMEWMERAHQKKRLMNRKQRFRFAWAMLEDKRIRNTAAEPWRYKDAVARDFSHLRVSDFALLQLGRETRREDGAEQAP